MSRSLQPLALQQPGADAPSRYMVSRPPARACSASQPVTVSARLEQPLRLYRLPLRWLSGSIPERTCPAAHLLKRAGLSVSTTPPQRARLEPPRAKSADRLSGRLSVRCNAAAPSTRRRKPPFRHRILARPFSSWHAVVALSGTDKEKARPRSVVRPKDAYAPAPPLTVESRRRAAHATKTRRLRRSRERRTGAGEAMSTRGRCHKDRTCTQCACGSLARSAVHRCSTGGAFASGDKVQVTQAPATPNEKRPGPGVIVLVVADEPNGDMQILARRGALFASRSWRSIGRPAS